MHVAIRYKQTDHAHRAKTLAGNHGHLRERRLRPRFTGPKNRTSTLGRAMNNQEMLGVSSFRCGLHDSQRGSKMHTSPFIPPWSARACPLKDSNSNIFPQSRTNWNPPRTPRRAMMWPASVVQDWQRCPLAPTYC